MADERGRVPLIAGATVFVAGALLAGVVMAVDEFPIGSYSSAAYTLAFKGDGSFQVLKSGYALVEGEYAISGPQIRLTDKRGPFACTGPGQATGTYNWKVGNGALVLSKVQDDCGDRSASFAASPWKKQ
jgi:hypothetical protein